MRWDITHHENVPANAERSIWQDNEGVVLDNLQQIVAPPFVLEADEFRSSPTDAVLVPAAGRAGRSLWPRLWRWLRWWHSTERPLEVGELEGSVRVTGRDHEVKAVSPSFALLDRYESGASLTPTLL